MSICMAARESGYGANTLHEDWRAETAAAQGRYAKDRSGRGAVVTGGNHDRSEFAELRPSGQQLSCHLNDRLLKLFHHR